MTSWFRWQTFAALVLALAMIGGAHSPAALAVTPIAVNDATDRIDITAMSQHYTGRGDNLQVDMAAVEGVTGRMAVRAARTGSNPSWSVFALHNTTSKTQVRWITAERYAIIGSGVIWPDLDQRRIEAITPSIGFLPERIDNDRADIFRVSLEPGQIVTFAAELSVDRLQQLTMWQPLAYQLKLRERQLFNGVLLGIAGLLGVFLTAIFAANHRAIFPSAALVAWCVLAYLCVDFGYWHKLLQIKSEDNAVYRAATEAAMAASLVIFLVIYLRLAAWYSFVKMIAGVWIAASLALVFVAVLDPRLAATFARVSFAAIGAVGGLLMLFLALRGQDRAIHLAPVWVLFLVWVFGASMALTGKLTGDIVVPSLTASLVLIVVLMGFVVTQFAFQSLDNHYTSGTGEQSLRSLAVDGSGAAVWEWHSRRDEISVEPIVEATLGLATGELSARADHFLKHLHPADRERMRAQLSTLKETSGGSIKTQFRLRHSDNSYRWFDLEASRVETTDRRGVRYVGLLRDITNDKRALERLMHDAVHDSLTNLPNRELFLDRLGVAVTRAKVRQGGGPAVLFIDIDKFKSVNSSYGLVVGDSLLLTISRRLAHQIGGQDTLARIGGDQFAILVADESAPHDLATLAESARRAVRAPIKIAGHDVVLTGAIGIAVYDGEQQAASDLLREAEIAMHRAKQGGADQIEVFKPEMRGERDDRVTIESELRKALETNQITVLYQPIIYLPTEELAGFEALVRWEHPRLGLRNPSEFVPVAEESDLIVQLGNYVLTRAVAEAQRWQKQLPRGENPLFVAVNVSSRQLLRPELVQEVRNIQSRGLVPDGVLRLEITEQLVMQNPEQCAEMLASLKAAGARLALDDFGTGYSSLAYLSRFPFDVIKIDRDIVHDSAGDGPNAVIVRSMVAMAHELGKKVVAEGVEDAADVRFLRSIGCEFAQGFYYGEPMQARDVMEMLKVVARSERKLSRRGFFRTKPPGESGGAPPPPADSKSKPKPARGQIERSGAVEPAPIGNEVSSRDREKHGAGAVIAASAAREETDPAGYRTLPLRERGRPADPPPPAGTSFNLQTHMAASAAANSNTGRSVGPPPPIAYPAMPPVAPQVQSPGAERPPFPVYTAPPPTAMMPFGSQPLDAPRGVSPPTDPLFAGTPQAAHSLVPSEPPSMSSAPLPPVSEPSAAALTRLDTLRTLPPGIAQSLAKLAGVSLDGTRPTAAERTGEGTTGPQDPQREFAGEALADDGPPPLARPPASRRA